MGIASALDDIVRCRSQSIRAIHLSYLFTHLFISIEVMVAMLVCSTVLGKMEIIR